jgi:hypothetical protein
MPTWNNLNEAFSYVQKFVASKRPDQRFELSEIDLALVSNFKGGNASIVEPLNSLPRKLRSYSLQLRELNDFIRERPLRLVLSSELDQLGMLAKRFISLTKDGDASISGFGPSYASALLAAHFPDTIPVLDRLVLSETGIRHSSTQVKDIELYYPTLIAKFHETLLAESGLSLRDLDRRWFERNQARRRLEAKNRRQIVWRSAGSVAPLHSDPNNDDVHYLANRARLSLIGCIGVTAPFPSDFLFNRR